MGTEPEKDWNPETYARFRDFRLRPALDLLAQVGPLPAGDVVDLGCGAGAVAAALAERFPDRRFVGVDTSPAMLDAARATGRYHALVHADIADWSPAAAPALIFSNAALHWLGRHDRLLPRLAGFLAPGGTLAVQMPRQFAAPSHKSLRDVAVRLFPDRFDFTEWEAPVALAQTYARMLAPLGEVVAWETSYVQRLAPGEGAHPVRRFTESTAMRPFLEKLSDVEATRLIAEYEAELEAAYAREEDGSVYFPFRRVFFTISTRPTRLRRASRVGG